MLTWLKTHWYVPVLFIGVILAFVVGTYGPGITQAPPGTNDEAGSQDVNPQQQALREQFEQGKIAERGRRAQAEPERTTDEIIADHVEKLEAEPPPEEAAARLAALGNLHRQKKQDYATAARYFEELIQNYPDWPGINGVYHQLIACYTALEDQESLRLLYRKMVEVFPEDSNEYEFAKHALENP